MAENENPIARLRSQGKFGGGLGLTGFRALMERLGNPQNKVKSIHVAGTNGKGSVCRYIYAVLRGHGYSIGIYTSPFVVDFYERIECDGRPATEDELSGCVHDVMACAMDISGGYAGAPSEYEVLSAAAFLYFSKKGLDFLVVEAGLGGKEDCSNAISSPIVCVITSISLDHMDRLGDSLTAIAREKAGIIKRGRPVITRVEDSGAAGVIAEQALKMGATLICAGDIAARDLQKSIGGYSFSAQIMGKHFKSVKLSMPGMHQVGNAICALCVIEYMTGKSLINIDGALLRKAMKAVRLPGRFEVLGADEGDTTVILDGAHNAAAATAMAETVRDIIPGRRIIMVVGMARDKPLLSMIRAFDRIASAYIATEAEAHGERKLPAEALYEALLETGKPCKFAPDPIQAFEEAWRRRKEFDSIIVSGSLYLSGAISEHAHASHFT